MDKSIILKKIRLKKVLTIEALTVLLARSIRTARRFVKERQIITSINKNARFYTLPDIPTFDKNGIWQYQGIFFSQYGNLKQTILHLILVSEAGLTTSEVGRMVGLADNSPFMSTFKKIDTIKKEELGNRGYIYYAYDLETYQQQKKLRIAMTALITSLPSDTDTIAILIELIKHPGWSSDELAKGLRNKGKQINRDTIERLIVHHDLKKTTE